MTSPGTPVVKGTAKTAVSEQPTSGIRAHRGLERVDDEGRASARERGEGIGLWRSFYEEALAAGSPTNAARFVATQRLRRLHRGSEAAFRGDGDFDSYY